MTHPRLSFGEMTVLGELARSAYPFDELGLAMAVALGRPDPPAPPFATVPVLLDGHLIGHLRKFRFVDGPEFYDFLSLSGGTNLANYDRGGLLEQLAEVLQLTSPP